MPTITDDNRLRDEWEKEMVLAQPFAKDEGIDLEDLAFILAVKHHPSEVSDNRKLEEMKKVLQHHFETQRSFNACQQRFWINVLEDMAKRAKDMQRGTVTPASTNGTRSTTTRPRAAPPRRVYEGTPEPSTGVK
jgi:hypothetical protein